VTVTPSRACAAAHAPERRSQKERLVTESLHCDPASCDRFLVQMVVHHRRRDHYPDPTVIGTEVQFAPALTEAVVRALWAKAWIACSPYATERIRITAWGWRHLEEATASTRAAIIDEKG
jgi:hypothetical protein